VFVIHWNAPEWCEQTIDSILDSRGVIVQLTVIDNGSRDLPRVPKAVKVVRLPKNVGYASAANVGLRTFLALQDRSEFCVVASHDLRVHNLAFERCLQVATTNLGYGILGLNGHRVASEGIDDCEWVSGTCLVLRRACVQDVGFFDPLYGSYVEDRDYCVRARARGWKVACVLDARADAVGSSSPKTAAVMTRANLTLLAAKQRRYKVVGRRLCGMAWRAAMIRGEHWPEALGRSVVQLGRWMGHGLPRA
jgi:GT2 family glycosyltransferase